MSKYLFGKVAWIFKMKREKEKSEIWGKDNVLEIIYFKSDGSNNPNITLTVIFQCNNNTY